MSYFDHAATTPVRDEVVAAMAPFYGPHFGNPSSAHRWGREARAALERARETVARVIHAHPDEISFVSCGTEGNNAAVLGRWRSREARHVAVVTTPIEHKAILGAVSEAAVEGAEERFVNVDDAGQVSRASFELQVRPDVAVASVMWVNNEVGTVQDVATLGQLARDRGVFFHTDAVQAFGKVPINVSEQPVDALTISGHKIGAPKGIAVLYVRRGTSLQPLIYGGGQEHGRRAGTENVAYVAGLARAMELAVAEQAHESVRLQTLRDALEQTLVERISDLVVNGAGVLRAPHILNISIAGAESDTLLMMLDDRGVAASSGSACQTGSVTPSHVLIAMGVAPELAAGSIRFSLGSLTTDEDVDHAAKVFPTVVERARRVAGFAG